MAQEHFTTRRLTSMSEFASLVELQRKFTDIQSKYIVAEKVFHVLSGEGGAVIGVFDDSHRLSGFAVHFPCMKNEQKFALSYRTVLEPKVRENGIVNFVRSAQLSAAFSDGLPVLKFDVPALPFDGVQDAMSYPGSLIDEFVPTDAVYQQATSLLVSWPAHSKEVSRDVFVAPRILDYSTVNNQPVPGRMNLEENAPTLLIPVPTMDFWQNFSDDIKKTWSENLTTLLNHYFMRGYAIVQTAGPRRGEILPYYVLANSLV